MTIKTSFFRIVNDVIDVFDSRETIRKNARHDLPHAYVEFWVRVAERFAPAGMDIVTVPKWVAKLFAFPDSAYTKGKTRGYFLGHVAAAAFPVGIILFFVTG